LDINIVIKIKNKNKKEEKVSLHYIEDNKKEVQCVLENLLIQPKNKIK